MKQASSIYHLSIRTKKIKVKCHWTLSQTVNSFSNMTFSESVISLSALHFYGSMTQLQGNKENSSLLFSWIQALFLNSIRRSDSLKCLGINFLRSLISILNNPPSAFFKHFLNKFLKQSMYWLMNHETLWFVAREFSGWFRMADEELRTIGNSFITYVRYDTVHDKASMPIWTI